MPVFFQTLVSFVFVSAMSAQAFASTFKLDVSGRLSGESAGDISLHLSYADAEKKTVKIEGWSERRGRKTNISEEIELTKLDKIVLRAIGSDGADGRDGQDGWAGRNGRDGWDGCPPGDGYDGEDGEDGRDGENGEDGGHGGKIEITTSNEQNELMSLISARTGAGDGGRGGSAGRGGEGGRGGDGGRNTCTDRNGRRTGGPDGRDGQDGWDGRSGSSGWSGSNGRPGSISYYLVDASGARTRFQSPFKLKISEVKSIDDNEDTVLEPGEQIHWIGLKVSNTGKMPTPLNQAIQLAVQGNDLLDLVKTPNIALNEVLQPGSSKELSFQKGELVFKVQKKDGVIGKRADFTGKLSINNIAWPISKESGYSVHWRVGLDKVSRKATVYFDKKGKTSFSIKNVSNKKVGPDSDPIEVQLSWSSKEIPGKDVVLKLKDGREFDMSEVKTISDFSVGANSALDVPIEILVHNRKDFLVSDGQLKVSLKMQKAFQGIEIADSAKTSIEIFRDLREVAIKKTVYLKDIRCAFYHSGGEADVGRVILSKKVGSDQVKARWAYKNWPSSISPTYKIYVDKFVRYSRVLVRPPSKAEAKLFMNRTVGPASRKHADKDWGLGHCRVVKGAK